MTQMFPQTKPRWLTATILENRKIAISQKQFEQEQRTQEGERPPFQFDLRFSWVGTSQAAQLRSPVLITTGLVNENPSFLTPPHRIHDP